jgi:trans-2,3-dihydro-3-hydroxyanthranilate isomerase
MEKLVFYLVDVFAQHKYMGNQLAVVRGANVLSDQEMLHIAKEMNYSETTFIMSDHKRDDGYDVKIFSPEEELPFGGHPTLGTAFIINEEINRDPDRQIILNLKCGKVPVNFDYKKNNNGILWMKQIPPVFGESIEKISVGEVLSINSDEIIDDYPVQQVSTGLPFIIVPVKSLEILKKVRIDKQKYFKLIEGKEAKAILVFSPETYFKENDLCVRVFADYHSVPEDPATGSGNGCLAAYLVKYSYLGSKEIDLRVEQGYEIKRPSLIYIKCADKGKEYQVHVGGKVVMVAKGELL